MGSIEYDQVAEYLRIAEPSKYSPQDIKSRFETESTSDYGSQSMASWIPDFAYAHQLLLESIAIHLPEKAIGIDLGAGNGRVSRLLLDTFTDLQLTLVDISPHMLGEAKKRLADYSDRCQFIVHDIFDPSSEFPAGSLDCIVSVFAICHAQGAEVYEQLY